MKGAWIHLEFAFLFAFSSACTRFEASGSLSPGADAGADATGSVDGGDAALTDPNVLVGTSFDTGSTCDRWIATVGTAKWIASGAPGDPGGACQVCATIDAVAGATILLTTVLDPRERGTGDLVFEAQVRSDTPSDFRRGPIAVEWIGTGTGVTSEPTVTFTTDWQRKSVRFNPPTDAKDITLQMRGQTNAGGVVCFEVDAIVVRRDP